MKIYDFVGAPNPKRLRIYLAEKGLDIELSPVNVLAGEQRSDSFRAKNPMKALPVLELDDGRCFSESLAIMEFLEELHPDPPMLGTTPEERLRVRELERICEIGVLLNVALLVQNTSPFFAERIEQSEAGAHNGRRRAMGTLKVLDAKIAEQLFVAGDAPTIADCTLFAAIGFASMMGCKLDLAPVPNVARWYQSFKQRPSAGA